jgi:hypothetical protein
MSTPSNNLTSTMKFVYNDGIAIPYIVRFWLFLISNILSLICCIFVLLNFLLDSTLRGGLHNHVMIVVLFMCVIFELTDVPWTIHLYLSDVVWIQTQTFCIIWKFIDSTIYTSIPKLVAWASIERHILIFHSQWVATKKRRYLIHYTPIVFIVIYGIMVYGITTPMKDCGREFYYFVNFCGYSSCIYDSTVFSLYEFITGGLLCSTLIGFGSVFLVLRVVFQKHRLQQQMQWRKHRKMTIQLLSIASIFFIFYLPLVILGTAYKLGLPSYIGVEFNLYANFFSSYTEFLLPFACINTLPKLRTRIKNTCRWFWRRRTNVVAPQQLPIRSAVDSRTLRRKTTAV